MKFSLGPKPKFDSVAPAPVSLQHISSLVMWEPSRNSSLYRRLLDLSIGEPAGEWEFGVNAFASHSTLKLHPKTEYQDLTCVCQASIDWLSYLLNFLLLGNSLHEFNQSLAYMC